MGLKLREKGFVGFSTEPAVGCIRVLWKFEWTDLPAVEFNTDIIHLLLMWNQILILINAKINYILNYMLINNANKLTFKNSILKNKFEK